MSCRSLKCQNNQVKEKITKTGKKRGGTDGASGVNTLFDPTLSSIGFEPH